MRNVNILTLLVIMLPLMLGLTGCTHNNGDIGPLFGNWQLTSLQSDIPDIQAAPDESYYWAFQSTTLCMNRITDHGSDRRFGNFRATDGTLFLDFSSEEVFGRPLFNLPRQCEMQIIELDSKKLVVQYRPSADKTATFTFRKW